MKKKILYIIISIITLLIGIFLIGNNYQMKEEKVTIPTTGGDLSAVMTFPKKKKIKGVILFIHGDGAQEATQNGGYYPLMERFAKEGYVSMSWDKLGVGNSTGNWLTQSMDDRANEAAEVITWLKQEHPETTGKIGLWGASQAGWVIPKVMNETKNNIDFAILAAPAINWLEQGAYDTFWQAKRNGSTDEEAKIAQEDFLKDVDLIDANDSYADYKKNGGTEEFAEDRYQFIKKNMKSDVTEELTKINTNIGLVLAENDKNVNSEETKKIYSQEVNPRFLEVKTIPNVEHQMINPSIASSPILINLVGIMAPKYFLIDQAYLDYCEEFVSQF